ncbi:MAG: hypothetical protein IJY61_08050 [Candidatus Gastranaerophilales bacterium]|nr:hypothetical protein [Candidatus Gastranaerophilales bacterium]
MSDMNITGNYQQISANQTNGAAKVEKEEEASLFPSLETDEILDILFTGVVDGVFGDGPFTKDEATIYVQGEKEIAELVKETPNKQNLIETIFDPDKAEREIREQYAAEHPEYAEVMEEGAKVQENYDKAYDETLKKWQEENPAPEKILEEGGFLGVKMTDDYKEWTNAQIKYMQNFEKEYAKNNSDYANLKAAQDKDKSFLQAMLGL